MAQLGARTRSLQAPLEIEDLHADVAPQPRAPNAPQTTTLPTESARLFKDGLPSLQEAIRIYEKLVEDLKRALPGQHAASLPMRREGSLPNEQHLIGTAKAADDEANSDAAEQGKETEPRENEKAKAPTTMPILSDDVLPVGGRGVPDNRTTAKPEHMHPAIAGVRELRAAAHKRHLAAMRDKEEGEENDEAASQHMCNADEQRKVSELSKSNDKANNVAATAPLSASSASVRCDEQQQLLKRVTHAYVTYTLRPIPLPHFASSCELKEYWQPGVNRTQREPHVYVATTHVCILNLFLSYLAICSCFSLSLTFFISAS